MEEARSSYVQVLEWISGKNDGVDKYLGYPSEGTEWFLISNLWLNRWKRAYKLTEDIDTDEMQVDLKPIKNEDIIFTDSYHHIHKNNNIVKPECRLGTHYEILPKKAWKRLKQDFGCDKKIKRISVESQSNSTMVEITLRRIRFLYVIDKKLASDNFHYFHISKSATVSEMQKIMFEYIQSILVRSDYPMSKLWKLDIDEILQKYPDENNDNSSNNVVEANEHQEVISIKLSRALTKLQQLIEKHSNSSFEFPGILVDRSNSSLENEEFLDSEVFIIETRSKYNSSEIFREKKKEQCEYCRKQVADARRCFCKRYFYCNDVCEENDRNYHCCRIKEFKEFANSKWGKVGLQNLGNTCCMNSGLQCLSHTRGLTEFILSGNYVQDINRDNILGSKGLLVDEYVQLVKEMWWGTSSSVSPWGVKKAFGDFAKQFVGFFQQDSQEMLGYLIDGIHEDLNRIKTKPYIEDPDSDQINEKELAERYWEKHTKRNDSIVVDLMHGQYRSKVKCPDCGYISKTFDPFLMVTLPIPEKEMKDYEFLLIDEGECVKGKVHLSKGANAGEVRDKACELLQVSNGNLVMAEISMNTLKTIVTPDVKVKKRMNLVMYRQNLPDLQSQDELATLFMDFRKKSMGYSGHVIGNPFLFTVKKDLTMEELYKEVFTFIRRLKKNMETEDLEQEFKSSFSGHYSRVYNSENYFSLKVHNPYQHPCSICEKIACAGCPISIEQRTLGYYLGKCKETNLRVSVIFGDRVYDTSFMPTVTNHESCFHNINTPGPSSSVELSECFEKFAMMEQLDEDNKTYCSKCKDHKQGLKEMGIFRLPEVLIIHLKRFKPKKYHSSKNNKLVEFPLEGLDMRNYSIDQEGIYDLYAVSNHYGSLEGGHYTAYAKCHDGVWREFDDNSVSEVNDVRGNVVSTSAYVLFYQRKK